METSWIKLLAVLLLMRISIGIIHMLLEIFFDIKFSRVLDEAIYVAQLTVMGYYGLKLGMVYEPGKNQPKTIKKSYRHSPLKAEERMVLKNEIIRFFNETDDYLQPGFSLAALSEALHKPRHYLSETINSEMNSTFYDLVNTKRIEFVLQQLKNNVHEKVTVETLGYDAGFNTKSAFYHHFKKHTGKTPGQYKSQISSLS